jgi:hypothetical protein
MAESPPNTLAAIEAAIRPLREELAQNPVYLKLMILEEARRQILKITNGEANYAVKQYEAHVIDRAFAQRVPMHEAAERAIEAAGRPLTTAQLIEAVPKHGGRIGGKNPRANLVSILSKRAKDRLYSAHWGSGPAWWIRGRPLPSLFEGVENEKR